MKIDLRPDDNQQVEKIIDFISNKADILSRQIDDLFYEYKTGKIEDFPYFLNYCSSLISFLSIGIGELRLLTGSKDANNE